MAWRKKSKKEVPIVPLSEEEIEKIEEEVADLVKSQMPMARVKRLIRVNPDVELVNSEAMQLMTKAMELFIKELSRAANEAASQEKRKTVHPKDIDSVIKKTWKFAFLEDALDGWPKHQPKKRVNVGGEGQESQETQESHMENQENFENPEEDDVIEEAEDELPETVPQDVFAEQF